MSPRRKGKTPVLAVADDEDSVMVDLREVTTGPKPPTEEEMAAILCAVEMAWPRPTVEEDVQQTADAVWKFANRWWQGGSVLQRGRPRRPSAF